MLYDTATSNNNKEVATQSQNRSEPPQLETPPIISDKNNIINDESIQEIHSVPSDFKDKASFDSEKPELPTITDNLDSIDNTGVNLINLKNVFHTKLNWQKVPNNKRPSHDDSFSGVMPMQKIALKIHRPNAYSPEQHRIELIHHLGEGSFDLGLNRYDEFNLHYGNIDNMVGLTDEQKSVLSKVLLLQFHNMTQKLSETFVFMNPDECIVSMVNNLWYILKRIPGCYAKEEENTSVFACGHGPGVADLYIQKLRHMISHIVKQNIGFLRPPKPQVVSAKDVQITDDMFKTLQSVDQMINFTNGAEKVIEQKPKRKVLLRKLKLENPIVERTKSETAENLQVSNTMTLKLVDDMITSFTKSLSKTVEKSVELNSRRVVMQESKAKDSIVVTANEKESQNETPSMVLLTDL